MLHGPAARIRLPIPSPNFRILDPGSQARFAEQPPSHRGNGQLLHTCRAQRRDRSASGSQSLGLDPGVLTY